jgi:magnesium chelatase subunit ChlD-like protein
MQKGAGPLQRHHLRYVRREPASPALHCFLLDCSASMLRGERLAMAKGLVLACFDQAAMQRSQAALICFGGGRADLRFGPAIPRWWNERWIEAIGGGGGTSFSIGVAAAEKLLSRARRQRPGMECVLWVFGDGRSRDRPAKPDAADRIVIVDCEQGDLALGRCVSLAREWGADYVPAREMALRA